MTVATWRVVGPASCMPCGVTLARPRLSSAFAMVLDMLTVGSPASRASTSNFGVEFDSFADMISFGVAPATLVYAWGLEPLGRLGWAAGFLYVTATAMRLARFQSARQGRR